MGPNYYVKPAPTTSAISKKVIFIAVGLVIALLIGFFLVIGTNAGNSSSSIYQRLLLRLEELYTFSIDKEITRDLKDDGLNTANTELTLSLGTHLNKLRPILSERVTDSNAQVIASEEDTSSTQKLEAAITNNKLDREYRNILLFKVKNARALIVDAYPSVTGAALKSELRKTNDTLKLHQEKLEKVNL